MTFTSFRFLLFLICLFLAYYLLPRKWQKWVLLAGNLVFYAFAGWTCLAFLAGSVGITYAFGRWLSCRSEKRDAVLSGEGAGWDKEEKKAFKAREKKTSFGILCLGLVLNIGLLASVKYTHFVLGGLSTLFSFHLTLRDFLIPMGISFYVFQGSGYLIDVYRETAKPEKNLFRYALFVTYFPQLIQGPISRFNDLEPQLLGEHSFDSTAFSAGLIRVIWGFFKKLVIADRVLVAVRGICENPDAYDGVYVFLLILLYSIVIYADFTGGIDITMGVSEMLGIRLKENFRHPFASQSVKEYWRRWHITMGTWFADYIFYPLSVCRPMQKLSKFCRKHLGNGLGKRIPIYLATLFTWFLTGLWHGAGWNFIVWGLLNGVLILVSQELNPLFLRFRSRFPRWEASVPHRIFRMARTFLLVGFIRILDVYGNVPLTFRMWGAMFRPSRTPLSQISLSNLGLTVPDLILVAAGVLLMWLVGFLGYRWETKGAPADGEEEKTVRGVLSRNPELLCAIGMGLVFCILLFGAYGIGYDASEFIYRQF